MHTHSHTHTTFLLPGDLRFSATLSFFLQVPSNFKGNSTPSNTPTAVVCLFVCACYAYELDIVYDKYKFEGAATWVCHCHPGEDEWQKDAALMLNLYI